MTAIVSAAHQRVITGAEYVRQITGRKSDRRARMAFQQLVLSLVAPGATVFDFGCGTGLDARCYAERGCIVRAYDVDAEMSEYFARHCEDFISAGRIKPETGPFQDFLCRDPGSRVDLVTANFAPVNLVADLKPLFAKFHALTQPGGRVLISVLNPYFAGDLQYGWWWRKLPRLWRHGRYSVRGAQAPIFRRSLDDLATQASPYFELTHVFRGLPSRGGRPHPRAYRTGRLALENLRLSTSRFVFALYGHATSSRSQSRA